MMMMVMGIVRNLLVSIPPKPFKTAMTTMPVRIHILDTTEAINGIDDIGMDLLMMEQLS